MSDHDPDLDLMPEDVVLAVVALIFAGIGLLAAMGTL